MGQAESNESAAVKRQAEGGSNPMYELLDLAGKITIVHLILKGFLTPPLFKKFIGMRLSSSVIRSFSGSATH